MFSHLSYAISKINCSNYCLFRNESGTYRGSLQARRQPQAEPEALGGRRLRQLASKLGCKGAECLGSLRASGLEKAPELSSQLTRPPASLLCYALPPKCFSFLSSAEFSEITKQRNYKVKKEKSCHQDRGANED